MLPEIPQFPAYSRTNENYMAIDDAWAVNIDYTQTYTVTVDELNQAYDPLLLAKAQRWRKARKV